MKYVLYKHVIAEVPEIKISEKRYQALKGARDVLFNALAIEEKYEVLISNYLEFEKEIFSLALTPMVRNPQGYSDAFDIRLGLNIRLVNLLTSARLYLDQLPQHIKKCLPERDDIKQTAKSWCSAEYDAHPDYQFMEVLRNHVQHYGLPVHWTSFGGHRTSIEEDAWLEYSLELAALKERLRENKKFKKNVLANLPKKVDLKTATRRYLESLGNIHAAARSLIAEALDKARETIEEAHSQYSEHHNGSLTGLRACKLDDDKCLETVPLLLDWDDVRVKLQRRNRNLPNLTKSYVTGRPVLKP